MKSVSYVCSYPMLVDAAQPPGAVGRPWIEVNVLNSAGTSRRLWCLVDSGSDATILDLATASHLGVYLDQLPQRWFNTAGGSIVFGLLANVDIEFAGTQLTTDVLFGSIKPPVLGRDALFDAGLGLEVGFVRQEWHHT